MFPRKSTKVRLYLRSSCLSESIWNGFQNLFGCYSEPIALYTIDTKKMFSIEEGFQAKTIFIIVTHWLAQINNVFIMVKQSHFLTFNRFFFFLIKAKAECFYFFNFILFLFIFFY